MAFKHAVIGNISMIRWYGEITTTDMEEAENQILRHKRVIKSENMIAVGIMDPHLKLPSSAVQAHAKKAMARGLLVGFKHIYIILEHASWISGMVASAIERIMRIAFLSHMNELRIRRTLTEVLNEYSDNQLFYTKAIIMQRAIESGLWNPDPEQKQAV